MFKVGDKVEAAKTTGYSCVREGDLGTVVEVRKPLYIVAPETADWDGCKELSFYEHELEKVPSLEIGDKVKIVKNISNFYGVSIGDVGEVVDQGTSTVPNGAPWFDVNLGKSEFNQVLCFREYELEKVEEPAFVAGQRVSIGKNPFCTVPDEGATGTIEGPSEAGYRGDFLVALDNRENLPLKKLSFKASELTLLEEKVDRQPSLNVGQLVEIVHADTAIDYLSIGELGIVTETPDDGTYRVKFRHGRSGQFVGCYFEADWLKAYVPRYSKDPVETIMYTTKEVQEILPEVPVGTAVAIDKIGPDCSYFAGEILGFESFGNLKFAPSELSFESEKVSREEVLEVAVEVARDAFSKYTQQHLAKGPQGLEKAARNLELAVLMSDALNYKAD